MEEVRAFLSNPSSSQVKKLRGPLTGGFRIAKDDNLDEMNRIEEHRHSVICSGGTEYARAVKIKETNMYLQNEMERKKSEIMSSELQSLEHLSSIGASTMNVMEELTEEAMTEIYSKYSFQKKEDTNNLSINAYKEQILNRIHGFPVAIIEGPTGCGKTTQVPQWILDECYQNHKPCKIVVTQPRRIAAISIAKRVAQERGWDVGGLVGYQVGLDSKVTNDTRIQYVTTGVLLQKLVINKTMNEYTHIILDEVHERGQEMDFLLLVVKRLLYTVSPTVKVILMSATFNKNAFSDYFCLPTPGGGLQSARAACVNVENINEMYTVKVYYLDNLGKFDMVSDRSCTKGNDPQILPEMHHLVIKLVNAFETIDQHEDGYTNRDDADLPSVLIFLPGIHEIEDLYTCLTDTELRAKVVNAECASYKWWVLPLHSTITSEEQARVFQRAQPGHRKIILATNIAESSITVPDVKYVIDYCLMKTLEADSATNFTTLRLNWASKTNCVQRAGRAGRVRDGRVYRLIEKKFYDSLPDECPPEIVRCPLERLVLLAKLLDMGSPSDVLALAMDPPDLTDIQRTILVLKEMGALKKTVGGEWAAIDGDITYLGRICARLPVDVKLAKLIVLGYIYGCLEETIVMAAAMSVKNLFSSPFRERLNAYNSKLTWADGSTSDCIAFLNVYNVWTHLRQQQCFRGSGQSEAAWARRFYVQAKALRELDELARDLRLRLSKLGIDPPDGKSPWNRHELSLLYKVLIAGAFYPQYFVQVSEDESRERDAVRLLGGLDPRNTVYLRNFPDNQPGEVYAAAIKRAVYRHISDEPRVTFDNNSRKVYLTFNDGDDKANKKNSGDPSIPGQVVLPVYKAVKARQLRIDIRIPMLPIEKAEALATTLTFDKMAIDLDKLVPRLPEIDDTIFTFKISQLNTVSKFWVQYADEGTQQEINEMQLALNQKPLIAYTGTVAPGVVLAAPYSDSANTTMCRVRVLAVQQRDMVDVLYIDYGSFGRVHTCNLRELARAVRERAPLAMRARLAGLAPAPLLDAHGHWSAQATSCFQSLVHASQQPLYAKIYSVVHGVVAIEVLANGGKLNVNEELIKRGFAIRCEESYESQMNHDLRKMATEMDRDRLTPAQKRAYNKEQKEMAYYQLHEIEPPSAKECTTDVCLKGPHSPLETTVHNLMYASRNKQVIIEWDSVNSVLLDTEPQERYERLLVAGFVGCNAERSRLTLRHTTLMPNIPGLPAILALLFCPVAELRRNTVGSRYVSALCGLGSTETGMPYLPEHDLLVDIDADLTVEDIGLINHIRHLMDYTMYCGEGSDTPVIDVHYRNQIPKLIRKDLMELLKKRRKHRESECVPKAWEWRSVPEHELLEINVPDMMEYAVVYPLHAPQELHPLSRDALLELKRETDQLKILVDRSPISMGAELSCKLCNTKLMPLHAMRIHLYSVAHQEKEEDFAALQS